MATLPAITPKDDAVPGERILAADFNGHADAINAVNEAFHERLPDGYRSLSGAAALLVTDNLVDGDTTGGSFALTLPLAADVPAAWRVTVDKIVAANTLTVQRAGADTINGTTSKAWTTQWQAVTFISNGVSAWRAVQHTAI